MDSLARRRSGLGGAAMARRLWLRRRGGDDGGIGEVDQVLGVVDSMVAEVREKQRWSWRKSLSA